MHRKFLIHLIGLMLVMLPSYAQLASRPRAEDLQKLIDSFGSDGEAIRQILKNLKRVDKLGAEAYFETQALIDRLSFPAVYRKRIESVRIQRMLGVRLLKISYADLARQCMKELLWRRTTQSRIALTYFCVALADGMSPRRAELRDQLNVLLDAELFDDISEFRTVRSVTRGAKPASPKVKRFRQVA